MYPEIGETALPSNKIKSKTFSLPVYFFGVLYFIYYLKRTFWVASNEFLFNLFDVVEWPIYVFTFFSAIIKGKYKFRDLILMFGVVCVFLLGYASTGYAEFLKAMMIIIALKDVNYKELFNSMYQILLASILLTVILYIMGVSDAGVQRRGASAFGYAQANSVGYVLMTLTLLTIVRKNKIDSRNKLVLALLNLVGFIIADSRTGFYLACVALLFSNDKMYSFIKKKQVIQKFLAILPMILLGVTLFTAVLYQGNSYIQKIDGLFSSRIAMNSYILKKIGISLFGHPFEYHGEVIYNPVTQGWSHYLTIDSAYMCLIIEFGLLITIVIGIAYYKLIRKLLKCYAIDIVLVMSILSLYGFTESSLLSIYAAFPFLLLLNESIITRNLEENIEDDT